MSEYEKLQMTAGKDEGGFVKNLKGQTGTGFAAGTHVHKDWYAKTQSYDEGMEALQKDVDEREDLLIPLSHVQPTINENDQFVFEIEDRHYTPTDWALGQFSTKSAIPSSTVLRELNRDITDPFTKTVNLKRDRQDAETMVALAENAMRRLDQNKKYRVRTYADGTMRAFLSERYACVDNRWYLDVLKSFLPGGRLSHWRGDADTIYGNILLPDTIIDYGQDDDSDYGGMLSIGNCEIGKRRVSQCPSLFRSICMNGCIWGQISGKKISKKHLGKINLDELSIMIRDNIDKQLPLIPLGVERLIAVRSYGCDDVPMKNLVAAVCSSLRFSKSESTEVLTQWVQNERQDRNLFGIVNSITRAGQTFGNDGWVRFDELGGSLLEMNDSRWNAFKQRADSFEEKELEKLFVTAI
jgi:hypothetical protein